MSQSFPPQRRSRFNSPSQSSSHLSSRTSRCPGGGPKCKLGYPRVFNLILWVLYTGMQWKCLPVPDAGDGTALIHYTTVYKVFAKWCDDGLLDQAFIASVRDLAEQKPPRSQHPAWRQGLQHRREEKAETASVIPATNTRRARRSSRSSDNNGFVRLAPLPVSAGE